MAKRILSVPATSISEVKRSPINVLADVMAEKRLLAEHVDGWE